MSDTTEALKLAFEKLGQLAQTYGGPAVDTAAEVVRVNAIGSLLFTAMLLVVACAAACVLRWTLKRLAATTDDYDGEAVVVASLVSTAVGLVSFGIAMFRLTNVWVWVALWNPKLALAAKLVNALPGVS